MRLPVVNEVFGIVVFYNQSIGTSKTLQSINEAVPNGQVLDLLIYDNSPLEQNVAPGLYDRLRLTYEHNSNNPGLSYAYNHGALIAREAGKKWLLVLDQDTLFEDNFFLELNSQSLNFPNIKLFAPILKLSNSTVLSPCKFDFRGRALKEVTPGVHDLNEDSPVNSGMVIELNAFHNVKGYNNRVKLDLSDHQFIDRFRTKYRDYFVLNSTALQDFSDDVDGMQQQLTRLRYYKEGTDNFETNDQGKKILMKAYLVVRALGKAFKYRSVDFLKVLIN